jgi:hypothetical protein
LGGIEWVERMRGRNGMKKQEEQNGRKGMRGRNRSKETVGRNGRKGTGGKELMKK